MSMTASFLHGSLVSLLSPHQCTSSQNNCVPDHCHPIWEQFERIKNILKQVLYKAKKHASVLVFLTLMQASHMSIKGVFSSNLDDFVFADIFFPHIVWISKEWQEKQGWAGGMHVINWGLFLIPTNRPEPKPLCLPLFLCALSLKSDHFSH